MNNNVFLILAPKEASGLRENCEILREANRTDSLGLVKGTYYSLQPFPVGLITWSDNYLRKKKHRNVGAWKHAEYSECKFQLQTYCPLTRNKLRNKGTTEENALVLSREISFMRLHLFYMFRWLNQEKPCRNDKQWIWYFLVWLIPKTWIKCLWRNYLLYKFIIWLLYSRPFKLR